MIETINYYCCCFRLFRSSSWWNFPSDPLSLKTFYPIELLALTGGSTCHFWRATRCFHAAVPHGAQRIGCFFFFTGNSEIWGQNIRNKNGLMSIHWDHVVGYPEMIQRTHDDVMLWEAVLMILCAWCMTITHDGMIMTMAMWGEYEHETETWSP